MNTVNSTNVFYELTEKNGPKNDLIWMVIQADQRPIKRWSKMKQAHSGGCAV